MSLSAPKATVSPKDRDTLWRETVTGFVVFVIGVVAIGWYSLHTAHGHTLDKLVLWIGAAFSFYGLYSMNKKLTQEWLAETRKFVPFLKRGGDSG